MCSLDTSPAVNLPEISRKIDIDISRRSPLRMRPIGCNSVPFEQHGICPKFFINGKQVCYTPRHSLVHLLHTNNMNIKFHQYIARRTSLSHRPQGGFIQQSDHTLLSSQPQCFPPVIGRKCRHAPLPKDRSEQGQKLRKGERFQNPLQFSEQQPKSKLHQVDLSPYAPRLFY